MAKKPTTADAQLILQLYDLRREAEMRKARDWWAGEFFPAECRRFPESRVGHGHAGEHLAAAGRRLLGHCCLLCAHGVLNEELFLQPGFSGEMFLIYAKIHPFVKELREKLNDPELPRTSKRPSLARSGAGTACSS